MFRLGNTLLANPALTKSELYNLRSDVKLTTDLAQKEPARFDAMKNSLQKLNAEIEAKGPPWWKGKDVAPKKKAASSVRIFAKLLAPHRIHLGRIEPIRSHTHINAQRYADTVREGLGHLLVDEANEFILLFAWRLKDEFVMNLQ